MFADLPYFDFLPHTHWDERIVAAAAVLSGAAIIWRKGIKPLGKGIAELVHSGQRAFDLVEAVNKEFSVNSGSTMKDALDRIEAEQVRHRVEVNSTRSLVADLHDRMLVMGSTLESVIPRIEALEEKEHP